MKVRNSGALKKVQGGRASGAKTTADYPLVSFRSCVMRSRALIGFWIKPLHPLSKQRAFMYGNALIAMIGVAALSGFSRIALTTSSPSISDKSIWRSTTSGACSFILFMAPAPVWANEMAKPAMVNCFVKYAISFGCLPTTRTVFGLTTTFIPYRKFAATNMPSSKSFIISAPVIISAIPGMLNGHTCTNARLPQAVR